MYFLRNKQILYNLNIRREKKDGKIQNKNYTIENFICTLEESANKHLQL